MITQINNARPWQIILCTQWQLQTEKDVLRPTFLSWNTGGVLTQIGSVRQLIRIGQIICTSKKTRSKCPWFVIVGLLNHVSLKSHCLDLVMWAVEYICFSNFLPIDNWDDGRDERQLSIIVIDVVIFITHSTWWETVFYYLIQFCHVFTKQKIVDLKSKSQVKGKKVCSIFSFSKRSHLI